MALDFKFELTDKGKRLLAKAMAGTQLEFTRFSVGAGKLTTQIPAELTALIQPIIDDIEIAVLKPMDHTALIGCQVDNKDITVGFSWTETGFLPRIRSLGRSFFVMPIWEQRRFRCRPIQNPLIPVKYGFIWSGQSR